MNGHEQFCLDTAVKFTAVRGNNPSNRIRKEFDSMEDAVTFANCFGDKRTMIYAINAVGNSAHICNA